MQPKPIAVLIADIHYSLPTLEVADAALRLAIAKANELRVPLIVAGDLHDTKANLRAECVNALLATFKTYKVPSFWGDKYDAYGEPSHSLPFVLAGNHDKINEKSEDHALNFLNEVAWIVDTPGFYNQFSPVDGKSIHLIPYQHDTDKLKSYLAKVDKGSTLIMHQGIQGSNSGDYIQDRSAITKQDVAGFRVISGHYHQRQMIQLPDGGVWNYIGNPYTLNFGEVKDPVKGFQILMNDGSLEFVATELRTHRIIDIQFYDVDNLLLIMEPGDIVWLKIRGPAEELAKINKAKLQKQLKIDFRLDLIPDETEFVPIRLLGHQMSQSSLLEQTINSVSDISDEKKTKINNLWKTFV